MRKISASLNLFLDDLVNSSVVRDPVERGTHRSFIGLRLLFAIAAFSVFPFYLIHAPNSGLLEASIFCWFAVPLIAVAYLSKTGDYDQSLLLSALISLPFLAIAAVLTGGAVASSMMIWLITPVLEAILSKHRRIVLRIGGLILLTAVAIMSFDLLNLTKNHELSPLMERFVATGSVLLAIIYVTLCAFSLEGVASLGMKIKEHNEDKYRLLASNMTDAILRHDANGNVRFASSAIQALTGVPSHLAMDNALISQIAIEDRENYKKALNECVEKNEPVSVVFQLASAPKFSMMPLDQRVSWLEEALNSDKSAKPVVWIEMKAQPINESNAEIVSVWRDITTRRLQEEKIEGVQKETARIQEMKSRFLANITHELRTPLNAVLGFSQMLQIGDEMNLTGEKRNEYAGLIHEAGDHLLGIVNSILDMSKLDSGRFDLVVDEFSLADLTDQCRQIISIRADQAGVKLHTIIADNLPEISADKRACRQILLNLLSNAIKFTPKGGSVTTHLRFENNAFVMSIADTGVGIAEEDLCHLGEAFYQARGSYDRPFEGTGLGLSIVKGLLALHHGKMDIKSRLNVGTVVTITLPHKQIEEETYSDLRKTA